jgi:hypothetical protein
LTFFDEAADKNKKGDENENGGNVRGTDETLINFNIENRGKFYYCMESEADSVLSFVRDDPSSSNISKVSYTFKAKNEESLKRWYVLLKWLVDVTSHYPLDSQDTKFK